MTAARRGRLIALEGGESCGKSTQASLLARRLGAVLTREPGGTELGELLRKLVLARRGPALDPRAEALVLAAARAQHVVEVIAPALEVGRHVVTDRFVGSTLAYQGFGRGLDLGALEAVSSFATAGLAPDVVVLLDVPEPVAAARRQDQPDRMEVAGEDFHRRVRHGYAALVGADPARWVVVDGAGTVEEVAERVAAAVEGRLALRGSPG